MFHGITSNRQHLIWPNTELIEKLIVYIKQYRFGKPNPAPRGSTMCKQWMVPQCLVRLSLGDCAAKVGDLTLSFYFID